MKLYDESRLFQNQLMSVVNLFQDLLRLVNVVVISSAKHRIHAALRDASNIGNNIAPH